MILVCGLVKVETVRRGKSSSTTIKWVPVTDLGGQAVAHICPDLFTIDHNNLQLEIDLTQS